MQQTTIDQMLFIAELNGFKSGTVEDKINYGIDCYANKTFPELDITDEEDRKDYFEIIWLERIYNELDTIHSVSSPVTRRLAIDTEDCADSIQWAVPVECDASASMLQYEGALLGDDRLLRMTNCIVGDEGLTDPWGTIAGVPRLAVKKRFTPSLYGSKENAPTLLRKAKKFTPEQIKEYVPLILKEERDGAFGLANMFKDFIIDNVNPSEEMEVHIWNEKFTIKCNRYKNLGEYAKFYKIYDSATGKELVFKNTHTKRIADLEQFRTYFVTLLVHNLDSQVANIVSEKVFNKYGWVIPIHDAFIVPPQAANDCKKWYAECITEIYDNRNQILTNYFKSIGITSTATKQWEELQAKIVPVEEPFKCNHMALK